MVLSLVLSLVLGPFSNSKVAALRLQTIRLGGFRMVPNQVLGWYVHLPYTSKCKVKLEYILVLKSAGVDNCWFRNSAPLVWAWF